MRPYLFTLFILNLFCCIPLNAQDSATTIILVRHAEKATTPGDDPQLSEEGLARAEMLSRMFENSGLTAIYATQYIRTRKTAEPIAHKLGLQVQTVDAGASKKLVEAIVTRHQGGTVLVVGHSNTLPEIIQALSGGKVFEIADDDYDNLYVVTLTQKGKGKTIRMKFFTGAVDQVCK